MRKLLIALSVFISYCNISFAQTKGLVIQGNAPDVYLNHVVSAKENYYSIGRLYNVSPKEIAPYNNLQFDKGLSLGQTIKIPLKQNNFSQGDAPATNEVLVPVYHVVQPKEGLYRVSINYNKVPLDLLKKWNHLQGDAVSNGTSLVVGYLKVDKEQSPLAKGSTVSEPAEVVADKKEEKKPAIIKTTPAEKEPVVKNTEKEKITEPVKEPVREKPVEVKQPVESTTTTSSSSSLPAINFSGGYFKKTYNDQAVNKSAVFQNGTAATFKTTSGWQDGKYYCFYNGAQPNTILKITNNANGKSIYAKVLDAIPDIKSNEGLVVRFSNAAGEELGVGETKFDCSITYSK